MNLAKRLGHVLFLATLFASLNLGAQAADSRKEELKKPPNYRLVSRQINKDYDLNWNEVPASAAHDFVPAVRCDLAERYHHIVRRPGVRMPVIEDDELLPPSDPDRQGVLPWPGILGHWQEWNSGLYLNIEKVEELVEGQRRDYMIVKLYSMCSDEMLAESSVMVKNPEMNRTLMIPTLSYSLMVNAEQMSMKVRTFINDPRRDNLEIELHYVDPLTKEPKRSVFVLRRFL